MCSLLLVVGFEYLGKRFGGGDGRVHVLTCSCNMVAGRARRHEGDGHVPVPV